MSQHFPVCPICASSEQEAVSRSPLAQVKASGIVRCRSCHFIYRHSLQVAYCRSSDGVAGLVLGVGTEECSGVVLGQRLALLESTLDKGALLDIGCGTGQFLAVAHRHGWQVAGIEPARDRLRTPLLFDELAIRSTLAEGHWAGGSFDAVTIWGALERSDHPDGLLRLAAHYCRIDGVLAVEATNADRALSASNDTPGHIFSLTALRRFLGRFGFRVERIAGSRTDTRRPPRIRGRHLHALPDSAPYSSAMRRATAPAMEETLTVIARYVP